MNINKYDDLVFSLFTIAIYLQCMRESGTMVKLN